MSLIMGKENAFQQENLIYESGDDIESISLIVRGNVRFESEASQQTIGEGVFIGVKDLGDGFYRGDYYALPGSVIVPFACRDISSFIEYLQNNRELHETYYGQVCNVMEQLFTQYKLLYTQISQIYDAISDFYSKYIDVCESSQIDYSDFLMPHKAELFSFTEQPFAQTYQAFLLCYRSKDKLAALFAKNPANYLKQQLVMIDSIYTTYEDMIFYLKTEVSLLASNSQDCLFYLVSNLMGKIKNSQRPTIMGILNSMKDFISGTDESIKSGVGISLDIDFNMVNFYFMMAQNATSLEDDTEYSENAEDDTFDIGAALEMMDDTENSISDLASILLSLCDYTDTSMEEYNHFQNLIDKYIAMPDKTSKDDDARRLRRDISSAYFSLYEKVFFTYVLDNNPPRAVKIFLDFGLVDERLVNDEHLLTLLNIKPLERVFPCDVYRMSDWLTAIYNGDKMPSKNEFDQDYEEHIRERKRQEALSPEQEKALLQDRDAKVRFEINNLLKSSSRILSNNMLSFTPMLSKYDFETSLDSCVLTSSAINDAVLNCLSVDYSAFYREQMYTNPAKKIDKEVIQLQVFPDIILFPMFGTGGLMWQDISGKRSNTKGRFLLPALYRGDLNNIMITLIGRFRWELCKTVMGSSWNNFSVPSLTSEYCDYIQFFRKNKDLSAEKREALKNQISRCRNNTREVFVSDYIQWVKFESNNAVRLNKVARGILATYCPFPRDTREKLESQPMFAEAMKRQKVNLQKKQHELTLRVHNLEKIGAEITPEIKDTISFYEM